MTPELPEGMRFVVHGEGIFYHTLRKDTMVAEVGFVEDAERMCSLLNTFICHLLNNNQLCVVNRIISDNLLLSFGDSIQEGKSNE